LPEIMRAEPSKEPMIEEILRKIERHERVRHALSHGGTLSLDRGLPFLIVHRAPPDRNDAGTARLVSAEAAYLVAEREEAREAAELVRTLARAGSTAYGAFLVLEVWSAPDTGSRSLTIYAPDGPAPEAAARLREALQPLRELAPDVDVVLAPGEERSPPDLDPLLSIEESWQREVLLLGLELPSIYRDADTGEVYPRFLRRMQRALSGALRRAIYEFIRVQTSSKVENHLALGTRTLPDRVWEVDTALLAIERTFDLLLLTSPVNLEEAWATFQDGGHEQNPVFHYRLLPLDPDLLKRALFEVPVEQVDDPALADLFDDKRQELDTQLTMLRERNTPNFRYGSQRLYGTVDDDLRRLAEELLATVRVPRRRAAAPVDAAGFRDAAAAELAHYRRQYPALDRDIQIRRDLVGLMVSSGNLLIGESLQLDPSRVVPLLHHEVGTHVLTYVNGSAQPLDLLSLGLAGYDELQEGLAVLSEYLVGGLTPLRMRLLAARVLAAHAVEQGAEFVETFRLLTEDHGYSASGAWHIALRVHACGGLTRDFIYLRGLVRLIEYLRDGGKLAPLYVGKMAQKHIPIIQELRHRGVLREPPLTPRFFEDPAAHERLDALRRGLPLTQMVSGGGE
jgi:uncharacterized protein (TIGR02421 family)